MCESVLACMDVHKEIVTSFRCTNIAGHMYIFYIHKFKCREGSKGEGKANKYGDFSHVSMSLH